MLQDGPEASGATASTILNAIRDSGKELMSTVNNMLKLNRWAETTVSRKPVGLHDWTQFEEDILYEVDQAMLDHEQAEVSILFKNNLSSGESTTLVDMALLKECVQSLVLNSLQATKQGAVIIVVNPTPDRSRLEVDVIDSGRGIAPTDCARIFEAYEKVDIHSRGAGLGLTLAASIARLMKGDVVLVSSSQDPGEHGSHFRATVATPLPIFSTSSTTSISSLELPSKNDLFKFYTVHEPGHDAVLVPRFARYLELHGFQQSDSAQGSVALVPYASDPELFEQAVAANPAKLFVCLTPARSSLRQSCERDKVRLFPGPFTTSRLKQIVMDIQRAWEILQVEEPAPGAPLLAGTKNGERKASTDELAVRDGELPTETTPFALLVDDNMVNLKIMQMYCMKRGIEHVTATNGEEAVDRFREQLQEGRPLNIILMDLQMPVCDGIEAVQRIRNLEKEKGPSLVPSSRIFMITGQDSSADKARSFAAGADEFYVKPMGMKKLDAGIGQHFPAFARELVVSK